MIAGQTVFLLWRPWLGPFQLALAEELDRRGAKIRLFVNKEDGVEGVLRKVRPGLFSGHRAFNILYDVARAPAQSLEKETERALRHERWMGLPYGHLAIGDRHLGRGFALGGAKFPTSSASRASRAQALAAFSAQIELWRDEIEKHRPALVIDGGRIVDIVAAAARVPFRILAGSRQGNLYYWAHNSFLESPEIRRAYGDLERSNDRHVPDAVVEQATPTVSYWRTAMSTAKLSDFARKAAYQSARRLWHLSRGKGPENVYDLSANIRYLWRTRQHTRVMTGKRTVRLGDLEGHRLVYFPLATEPESTLQGLSPEYFFQLEAIAAIARDLPADVLLAVKEHHPACGARDEGFYDKIWAFKNVVVLDMRERGPDVVARAEATVTISGSGGFEASVMGKPVIVLGRHNIYDFLPHVAAVRDIARLREALDAALTGRLAGAASRRDGALFLQAMKTISFDLESYDPFTTDAAVTPASVQAATEFLLRSLEKAEA